MTKAMADGAGSVSQPSSISSSSGAVTLTTWLLEQERKGTISIDLVTLLSSIGSACKQISALVRLAPIKGVLGNQESTNASGDEQKKLDVLANDIFLNAVASTGRTSVTVSEEEDHPVTINTTPEGFVCAFDPIDGSSNLDACISSGSIFAVYGPGECVMDENDDPAESLRKCSENASRRGTDLVCGGYCLYSSTTIFMLTVGDGVYGFSLDVLGGEFLLTHKDIKIPEMGSPNAQSIYAINEGNRAWWSDDIKSYVDELKTTDKPYSYRE